MSSLDRNIFELQPLEIRTLLSNVSVDGSHILQINTLPNPANVIVNKVSNGNIVVTINGTAFATQFTTGTGAGQFNQINIAGTSGNDQFLITSGVVYNSATVAGGDGNDTITTGRGNDVVSGNGGNDQLDGGVGNDLYAGGTGTDTANYSNRTGALRISLDNVANDGEVAIGEADNVQTDVEEVLGGSGNDTMTGSSGDNFFYGNGGADSLVGNGGNDELTGGSEQDQLFGNDGDDFLQAQNNDRDTVQGGTNSNGTADFDLANVDGLDVSGLAGVAPAAVVGPLALSAVNGGGGIAGPSVLIPSGGQPSDLDTTYGTAGKVFGPSLGFFPNTAAVDSLGRVIYVGTVFEQNTGGGYGDDFAIARYDANGNLDTSFGTGGILHYDFSSSADVGGGYNSNDAATAVAIGPNDSIVVVGSTAEPFSSPNFAVLKINANGTVAFASAADASGDGFDDRATSVIVQADGKIVVGGSAGSEGTQGRVARFLTSGLLDDSFNSGGIQFVSDFSSVDELALQTFTADAGAQRIVMGTSNGNVLLERLLSNGSFDSTFGSGYNSEVVQDFSGGNGQTNLHALAVDASNNIIIAGDVSNFTFTASLANGIPTPPAPNTTVAILAKFDANGQNVLGTASHVSDDGFATFADVTVDSSGRYVAVGTADGDYLIARLTSAMQPDTTFNPNGFVLTDFSSGENSDYDSAIATRVLGSGKIVAAGNSDDSSTEQVFPSIARYVGVAGNSNVHPNEGSTGGTEEFVNYGDLHHQPPLPEIQNVFNRVDDLGKLIILSQPDDSGVVRFVLGSGDDTISITQQNNGPGKSIVVNVNGVALDYDAATTKRIEIYGNGGNDTVTVDPNIKTPLFIDGGEGNDNLQGAKGNDVILGGPGNDSIDAGQGGSDVIIGGLGADNLKGDNHDDLIIAGTTAHDGNVAALLAISAEWGSNANQQTHIDHIRGTTAGGLNGGFLLHNGAGATVFDDASPDTVTSGGGAKDWLFVHTIGSNKDIVLGNTNSDVIDQI